MYEAVRKLGRPTVQEITDEVGLTSTSTTWFHLEILRAEGAVTWEAGKMRTIRVTDGS